MSSRRVNTVILCEDVQQEVFFRRLLRSMGTVTHTIRVSRNPAGKGCGEQYFRNEYPNEVAEFRRRSNHRGGCLITVIDADTNEVSFRYVQLDRELIDHHLTTRISDESIAIFVPRRNIMSWIKYLIDLNPIDETVPYQEYKGHESDCHPQADRMNDMFRQQAHSSDYPPSFKQGISEIERIPH